jgi:hypothetical protein
MRFSSRTPSAPGVGLSVLPALAALFALPRDPLATFDFAVRFLPPLPAFKGGSSGGGAVMDMPASICIAVSPSAVA